MIMCALNGVKGMCGYNELRIKVKHIPNFVISYDEPNETTLRY